MSEQLKKEETKQESVNDAKALSVQALNRFIYLREGTNTYLSSSESKANSIFDQTKLSMSCHVEDLVSVDHAALLNLIKKSFQNKRGFNFEAIWILVYCLAENRNEDLKKELRKSFNDFIVSNRQFLCAMYVYQIMKNGKLNLGRGMRTVLTKWYSNKSPAELANILFVKKKHGKTGHKNIIHQIHLKFDDEEKNKILQARFKKFEDLKPSPESSQIEKMIYKYSELKRANELPKVIAILKEKEFPYKLKHVPPFAHKSSEVVDLVLGNMKFKDVFKNLIKFCSHKLLKVNDPISKKICNALQVPNKTISEAKFNPIYVFQILIELTKRLSFLPDHSHKSENGNAPAPNDDNKKAEKKISNPFIVKRVQHIFNQTLAEQPKTGCRFFVTVNFRRFSKRQGKAFGTNIPCSDLQAIVALALLKNEKDTTIMSFTDDKDQLKPVEWSGETSYENALEIYEKEITEMPKTKENISLPLKKAMHDKKKVDVFITFVTSIARTEGANVKPDMIIKEINNYKRTMNMKMTKYIIVNMTRNQPDINFGDEFKHEKGLLEIVGFSENAMKIIEFYAKNNFA